MAKLENKDYMKIQGDEILVRGSAFQPYDHNSFTVAEARELAAEILTAANTIEAKSKHQAGDVVRDADGEFFIRNENNDGWVDDQDNDWSENFPAEPLVKYVPVTQVLEPDRRFVAEVVRQAIDGCEFHCADIEDVDTITDALVLAGVLRGVN